MTIKDFLRQDHIQQMLSEENLKGVYDCWGGNPNELTKLLIQCGIDPLNYLDNIPFSMYTSFDFEEFIVPEHIQRIGGYAFNYCKKLKHIYIPYSVGSIRPNAFARCNKDLVIHCEEGSMAHEYAIDNEIEFELME